MRAAHPDVAHTGRKVRADNARFAEERPVLLEQTLFGHLGLYRSPSPGQMPNAKEPRLACRAGECGVTLHQPRFERARLAFTKCRFRRKSRLIGQGAAAAAIDHAPGQYSLLPAMLIVKSSIPVWQAEHQRTKRHAQPIR